MLCGAACAGLTGFAGGGLLEGRPPHLGDRGTLVLAGCNDDTRAISLPGVEGVSSLSTAPH